jgi:hypothetical protein
MIFNSARTIYNVKLQTCKLLDLEYTPLINTTINESLNIYPNYVFKDKVLPKLNIATFGNGGSNIIDNNVLDLKRSKHGALDGILFNILPLMVKPYGTVLEEDEQNIYRLKTVESINNNTYDVYYGMVINNIDYDPRLYKISSNEISYNSEIIDTATNNDILKPIPKINTLDVDDNYNYIINTCKIGILLDSAFMNNFVEAIAIKYPDEIIDTITEIGLCSSVDVDIDDKKEAIWTQVNYFVDLSLDIQLVDSRIKADGTVSLNLDIGGMEPLVI